jgi:membrane protease YdiL (CAAX protease family)
MPDTLGRTFRLGEAAVPQSTEVKTNPPPDTRVAGMLHTAFVIGALAALALWSYFTEGRTPEMVASHRIRFYTEAIGFEWLLLALVVAGMRRSGTPIAAILGDRWNSGLQVLRDAGIAAAFWAMSIMVLGALGFLLRVNSQARSLRFMYPQGRAELACWIALSVTAGFCEEIIFRGYLQRQLIAFTGSARSGILLSAVFFGAGHAYQGFRRVLLLVVFGAGFGILARWRKNLRPGMLAHAWQDTLFGLLASHLRP